MDPRQVILELLAQEGGVEVADLKPETELVAHLGIDSPSALQLVIEIEDRLGIEIDDEDIGKLFNVKSVLEIVARKLEPADAGPNVTA